MLTQLLRLVTEDVIKETTSANLPGKPRGYTGFLPSGKYEIKYRTEGGFYNKYKARFADIDNNRGMLELQDVPNFKYILIHCGNQAADSSGCLLVANSVNNNQNEKGFAGNSKGAYKKIYTSVATQLDKGHKVYITIEDFDN